MSNLSPEKEYDNVSDWLEFSVRQMLKNIYTSMPGIVDSYDDSTKRAVISMGLTSVTTDGTQVDYPLLNDVPVLFQSTSKFILQYPIEKGDTVLVLFTQRGIGAFKESYEKSEPGAQSFFSMHDAVALPGFGTLTNTPAKSDAITIQTTDGVTYLSLEDGVLTLNAATINLQGDVSINGSLDVNGIDFDTHIHGGVQTGGGVTSGPQ